MNFIRHFFHPQKNSQMSWVCTPNVASDAAEGHLGCDATRGLLRSTAIASWGHPGNLPTQRTQPHPKRLAKNPLVSSFSTCFEAPKFGCHERRVFEVFSIGGGDGWSLRVAKSQEDWIPMDFSSLTHSTHSTSRFSLRIQVCLPKNCRD